MDARKFEDILIWQKAQNISLMIYKHFATNKDFWFKDQIQRAAISIMNNIAEWFERKWNKEFIKFLYIAKWSAGEVRSMLSIALELQYVSLPEYTSLHDQIVEISKMIGWLIKSLQSQPN